MSTRTRLSLALVAGCGLALAACSSTPNVPARSSTSGGSTARPDVIVHFEYDNFEPSHITIHAGQTVQWQWSTPQLPGNVTFEGFASPTQQTGAWAHTFSSPGTYAYRDTLRQVATGSVTVVP